MLFIAVTVGTLWHVIHSKKVAKKVNTHEKNEM